MGDYQHWMISCIRLEIWLKRSLMMPWISRAFTKTLVCVELFYLVFATCMCYGWIHVPWSTFELHQSCWKVLSLLSWLSIKFSYTQSAMKLKFCFVQWLTVWPSGFWNFFKISDIKWPKMTVNEYALLKKARFGLSKLWNFQFLSWSFFDDTFP